MKNELGVIIDLLRKAPMTDEDADLTKAYCRLLVLCESLPDEPLTGTADAGCGIVGDNITQVYDYVAEAKRNTLHHLLLSQAGGDIGGISPEQVAGLVNKAYEELERPASEAENGPSIIDRTAVEMINKIDNLCCEFGLPTGMGRLEWLRKQLTRLKELTEPNLDNADFSDALMWLKEGMRVARRGWNGDNQWVELVTTGDDAWGGYPVRSHFGLKNTHSEFVPGWVPSTGDLMATDWYLVK